MDRQPLRAVVFDWAGTLIDFGSHAPMGAFVELFHRHGVEISIEDARGPMGLPKWDHIQALGQLAHVQQQWESRHGRSLGDADVDALYEVFVPMNLEAVRHHATLVPGALDTIAWLRDRGVKIGTTTGYSRAIMEVVLPLVAQQGFEPDSLLCAGDLPVTRPTPLGMYQALIDLQAWPAQAVVKVDDTVPGLLEGRFAGCMTVGILASGNEAGLTANAWGSMDRDARQAVRIRVAERLVEARPDHLIDTVADLPDLLEKTHDIA